MFDGVTDTPVGGVVPLPLKATECGLPAALSVNNNVPVRAPVTVGLKLTGIVVDPLAATVKGEPGVGNVKLAGRTKSPGFNPPKLTPVICNDAVPGLLTVTDLVALVVPTD